MSTMPTILVVDDDPEIRDLLARFLDKHGLETVTAPDGERALRTVRDRNPDLVVLDLMLPGEDGFEICKKIRQISNVPVIMLTALAEDTDRIVGLELGADDYVTKPFNPRELLARIRAVMRRASGQPAEESADARYEFADWRLDTARRELFAPDGALVTLTAGEYDLLIAFLQHPRRVLDRDQLLTFTKGRMAQPFDRSVDVQLSRLRRKIEVDPKDPQIIKTVRGGGYQLTPAVNRT
ncbi:MAG: response regulator [Rhodospirillaceae bacterium]|nr:response regulator [Rhodospirillaceae bacterium]